MPKYHVILDVEDIQDSRLHFNIDAESPEIAAEDVESSVYDTMDPYFIEPIFAGGEMRHTAVQTLDKHGNILYAKDLF